MKSIEHFNVNLKDLQFIKNGFMDSFIKYIVITNSQDIQVESDIPNFNEIGLGNLFCKLGSFRLAKMTVCNKDEEELLIDGIDNEKKIKFDLFETRVHLRSLKIGALLFRKLQADVARHFPGYILYADSVETDNIGGQRFYRSMGGTIKQIRGNIEYIALFTADKLQSLSEIPVEVPKLEDYINKAEKDDEIARAKEALKKYTNLVTEGSPAAELRSYIRMLIILQRQFLAKGTFVPDQLRIPERIEISPKNLEYLLQSGAIDEIIQEEKEGEILFVWHETEEYPELKMGVKENDNGKSVLTYIESKSADGRENFVWDSKTKEGKRGILIISREDDALDELIDMEI